MTTCNARSVAPLLLRAGLLSVMLATACHGQAITQLGVLPGGSQSYAQAISADGTTVTGRGDSSDGIGTSVFRWTRTGGMQNLGRFPGDIHASGTAISADGSVIAGISEQVGAFRWTAADGLQSITVFGSTADGLSADGRAIVGRGGIFGGVFRWSVASGYENLDGNQPSGPATWGYATSADGSVVVGFTEQRATAWRSPLGTGSATTVQDLGCSQEGDTRSRLRLAATVPRSLDMVKPP